MTPPIVGIGASAYGLEALKALFSELPNDIGISFIVVANSGSSDESPLRELLQINTKVAICEIEHGMIAKANQIYLAPTANCVTIVAGRLQLSPLQQRSPLHKGNGSKFLIDKFLVSLAIDQTSNAACIILSGSGSDNTEGVRAIKTHFGLVIIQDAQAVAINSIAGRANKPRLADFFLPLDKIPEKLLLYYQLRSSLGSDLSGLDEDYPSSEINEILNIIHAHSRHDFRRYKKNTIFRRIERRMALNQSSSLFDYIQTLRTIPLEVRILSKEIMIGVTSFFRDPLAYHALSSHIVPALVANKPDDHELRVWVSGCSTGEEAYSIAIALYGCIVKQRPLHRLKIYATDINEDAIDIARKGIYPASVVSEIDSTMLARYFSLMDDGRYQIKTVIRHMIVFATQNVISDPPFTKLDMIVCRNLLIYFEQELQQDVIPLLHYSLAEDGVLFLGSSESIGLSADLFDIKDKKWKIFKRRSQFRDRIKIPHVTMTALKKTIYSDPRFTNGSINEINEINEISEISEISEIHLFKALLQHSKLAPCVIINLAQEVLFVYGRTGDYLELAEGSAKKRNLMDMIKPKWRAGIVDAIREAATFKQVTFHREILPEDEQNSTYLQVTIKPLFEIVNKERLLMVVFEEQSSSTQVMVPEKNHLNSDSPDFFSQKLKLELEDTRKYLRNAVEELEMSNQELKSINEEMQATNEELRSTVEELETSKEELQSVNEESITINAELEARVDELSVSNNDLKNLLDSTEMATVFLDAELLIQRYTPRAIDIMPITTVDMGRPLNDLATKLIDVSLAGISERVLDALSIIEMDVESTDERIYRLKALPYRTINNVVDGVVLTFTDITTMKQTMEALAKTDALYRGVFDAASDSIAITDPETLEFIDFNKRAHEHLGYTREEFQKLNIIDVEAKETEDETIEHVKNMAKGQLTSFDTQIKSKSGELHSVHVEARLVYKENRPLLVSTWFDIN